MTRFFLATLGLIAAVAFGTAAEKDTRVFQLRVYSVETGKQAAVNSVIAKTGTKYYKKYNIDLLGAWVPLDTKDERIFTLVAHKDMDAATKNSAAMRADEGFLAEVGEAMKDGQIITGIATVYLSATDYSPMMKAANVGDRVFELRTYISTPHNLENLNARFRDHTCKLFEKHGMTNVAYFTLPDSEKTTVGDLLKSCSPAGKEKSDVKPDTEAKPFALVYMISHKSQDAAKSNFGKFAQDPDWKSALAESEKKGGGPLTAKNAVKSLFLKATDYSPTK